jgi:hypothetical protein
VWDLHNANPKDVSQILQDLFNRNSTMRQSGTGNRSSLLSDNNPLAARETEQQNTSNANSVSESGGGRGGSGGSGP